MDFYETYEKAKAKTRKACDTSNLDTSDEEESRRSRCARRKRNLSQELQFLEEQPSRNQNKSPPYPDFEEEPLQLPTPNPQILSIHPQVLINHLQFPTTHPKAHINHHPPSIHRLPMSHQ
ncbi:uncharacterized protein LOC120354246 [Nilaparvata lugens]|uniref:uncharacterized protein LOC120354246 n=1 Tax=Nilaparvata lugens TaxID=108931 RepID=UPI00193CAD55|nr:uncharacterized protein LOC120354246 [Nilaparvata lugens]